jgi:hypothetical protein
MPKRARAVRRVPTQAEVEELLDRFESALLAGDQKRTEDATKRLWEIGETSNVAAEAVTRRLIEGRSRVPVMAFTLLEAVGGDDLADYLLRIAEDRTAQDLTRFAAMRRYGWPERGAAKRRLAFLDTLVDPDETLVTAVEVAVAGILPDGEVLEEVVGYLAVLTSERRRAILTHIVAEIGRPALRLLHALLHVSDAPTQRQVLTQLVEWREPASVGAVGRLAATARAKTVRTEAAAALNRLQLRDVSAAAGLEIGQPLPPVIGAFLSQLDGDGGQIAVVIRQVADGVGCFVDVFHNEAFGIKDTVCKQQVPAGMVEEMLADFEFTDVELVEVDVAAVRGALDLAAQRNAIVRKTIPPAYEIWEPLIHDAEPPAVDEPVVVPELDDAPYAGRSELLAGSAELLDHSWFESWFLPEQETFDTMVQTPPPSHGRLTDHQIRPLVEHFYTPELRAKLRARLRRQAWLLDQTGDAEDRDLALAVAAALADASVDDLVKNAFVRKMVRRSVEIAATAFYWEV